MLSAIGTKGTVATTLLHISGIVRNRMRMVQFMATHQFLAVFGIHCRREIVDKGNREEIVDRHFISESVRVHKFR